MQPCTTSMRTTPNTKGGRSLTWRRPIPTTSLQKLDGTTLERSLPQPEEGAELREVEEQEGAGAEALSPSVVVSRIKPDNSHDAQKWLKLSADRKSTRLNSSHSQSS